MTPLEKQLTRIEAMLRAQLDTTNPLMTFGEVMAILRYSSKNATKRWLRAHQIQKAAKGYRRVDVITAATEARS